MITRWLGNSDYAPTLAAMQRFTDERGPSTPDEIWLLEHPPVFTLGMAADRAHVLAAGDIPVVQTDRGGQVTYHGPGQLVMYPLIDIRRLGISVRALVQHLEQSVIELLRPHGIVAVGRRDAPGVYVEGRKLASVGMRIRAVCRPVFRKPNSPKCARMSRNAERAVSYCRASSARTRSPTELSHR